MRIPLGVKIVSAFTLIVFMALGISVGAANRFNRERYSDFSIRRDISRARKMAPFLDDWVRDALDLERTDINNRLPLTIIPSDDYELHGKRHHENDMMRSMMRPTEIFDPLIITDLDGRILLNTTPYEGLVYNPGHESFKGIAILESLDSPPLGYLYVGRMISEDTLPDDSGFLRVAGMSTWIVAAVVFIAAISLALLLTRHIVIPVQNLNRATHEVERGTFGIRIPTRRKDELGELTRGFNAMVSSLETADEQQRRLIADSAHELRTPVSLIRARLEMMENGIYPMDSAGLSALSSETERMVRLIEELRTLTSLESNNSKLVMEPLDIRALADSVIEANRPAREKLQLSVETQLLGKSPQHIIEGDPDKLYRLLNNLLSNALRYAASKIYILLNFESADTLEMRVEDDGPGIDEAHRSRIFERYYRIDASRNRLSGGTGLGLAICREIVSAHDGEIFAEPSSLLGGAALVVRLKKSFR